MSKYHWTTIDGKVLKLTELNDDHIKNIVSLLQRRGKTDDPRYPELIKERRRRLRRIK